MLNRFCVEINRQRRTELEETRHVFRNCPDYHDHLRNTLFPAPNTIIVLKEGNDYFRRHYGDATPGSGAVERV